jgi:hypothetical protein
MNKVEAMQKIVDYLDSEDKEIYADLSFDKGIIIDGTLMYEDLLFIARCLAEVQP